MADLALCPRNVVFAGVESGYGKVITVDHGTVRVLGLDPARDALMELSSPRLGERAIASLLDQDMPEAECLLERSTQERTPGVPRA